MAKFISKERLKLAVERLADFRSKVPTQGIQHLLPLLALKRQGVGTDAPRVFEESNDFQFWNDFFQVDPASEDGRYYDPFAGSRRIATHPHSNVATARKGTFEKSWGAAESSNSEDGTAWKLTPDYLSIVVDKCLTKGGVRQHVPALELAIWLRRECVFDDADSVASLVQWLREEFELTDAEYGAIFSYAPDQDEVIFGDAPLTAADVLEVVGEVVQPAGRPAGVGFAGAAGAAGITHALVLEDSIPGRCAAALDAGCHLLLAGPPGTGKTTLAEELAAKAVETNYVSGYITSVATADWTTFETIGGYMPTGTGNELEFREGVLLRSISEDSWCILDELNRSNIDRAIGAMFPLLSGAKTTAVVELPFVHTVRGLGGERTEPVRIRRDSTRERSGLDPESGDYVIGANWRLIATMNTFDRNSLFPITAAFTRRFATVFLDVPPAAAVLASMGIAEPVTAAVLSALMAATHLDVPSPRPLGPAVVEDAWRYAQSRLAGDNPPPARVALLEAVELFALPQYVDLEDGERQTVVEAIVTALALGVEAEAVDEYVSETSERLLTALSALAGA